MLTVSILPALFGQYTEINLGLPGTFGSMISFADYDQDSDLDLCLSGSTVTEGEGITLLYENFGGFSFSEQNTPFVDVFHSYLDWTDFNNDGYLDVVVCGLPSGSIPPVTKVYKGLANGQYSALSQQFEGADNACARWGDYNNDGRQDLIVTGSLIGGMNNPFTKLYKNLGNDSFALVNAGLPDIDYGSVNWIDYDRDGDLDLSFCGSLVNNLYRNNGNDSFSPVNPGFAPLRYGDAVWGDIDNDGDDDYLCCGRNASEIAQMRLYRNDGNDVFTSLPVNIPGHHSGSMVMADWDNDGWLDLLITGNTDYSRLAGVYKNDGACNFILQNHGFTPVSSSWAQWGDLDNDNKLDVVLSGYTGLDYVSQVFRNTAPVANTPPLPPRLSYNPQTHQFRFYGASDAETPSTALSYNIKIGTSSGSGNILSPCALANGYRFTTNPGRKTFSFIPSPGVVYYASAQAIDGGLLGSAFGEEICFTVNGSGALEVVGSNHVDFVPSYHQHLSEPQYLHLRNSGGGSVRITGISFYNSPSQFQLEDGLPALPWTLAPSESLNIAIRVYPTETGSIRDSLIIYSEAWNNPRLACRLYAQSSYAPPAEVGHLYVEIIGWDAHLSWDEVSTNILGEPLIPDRYVVLYCEDNEPGHFWFLASTLQPGHIHEEVALFSPRMFYQVKAVKFYRPEQEQRFDALLQEIKRLDWKELESVLLN